MDDILIHRHFGNDKYIMLFMLLRIYNFYYYAISISNSVNRSLKKCMYTVLDLFVFKHKINYF